MVNINMGLETALRSMRANNTAINTTSHNIANLNNKDYSRQLANITSTDPMSNAPMPGSIGTGSRINNIERIRDTYLDRQIRTEMMQLGKWSILQRSMENLAALFPEVTDVTAPGINSQLEAFWQGWEDLAAEYTKPVALQDLPGKRNAIYTTASNLAVLFNSKGSALTDLQIDMNSDLRTSVQQANTYLKDLAELNKVIIKMQGLGQSPNDLYDKRDLTLKNLSELMNINVAERSDGSTLVHVKGHVLVSGSDVFELTLLGGAKDSKFESVGLFEYRGAPPVNISDFITEGKIGGLINARDTVVQWYKSELDILAHSLITVVNKFHSAVTDGSGVNRDFFVGTKATSIAVNPGLNGGQYVMDTKYTNGDVATIMANLQNKLLNNWVTSNTNPTITSSSTLNSNDTLRINNLMDIVFTAGQTVEDLINQINTNSSSFSAIYDDVTHKFFMVSNEPITMQQIGSNTLLARLRLVEEMVSGAPVNYAGAVTSNQVLKTKTWLSQTLQLDTEMASKTGIVTFYYAGTKYDVSWSEAQTILTSVVNMSLLDGTPLPPDLSIADFNQNEQKFHFGTSYGTGNSITPIIVSDKMSNLTQTMKLTGNVRFGEFYNSMLGKLKGDINSSENILGEYTSTVDHLEGMQQAITQVDENEEIARAKQYQRAYDASVKLMAVIDEMLNMLINRMPTSSSNSSD